jgi:2-keto-4-pentenoate hydratase
LANERASEPTRAERGFGAPASERVGESEGRSPSEGIDIHALASQLAAAYVERRTITPPSARDGFDLTTAYAVERDLVRRRRAEGRHTVGVKVGYANKAMWRVLKLETLVWAHMYDDTVRYADACPPEPGRRWANVATVSVAHTISPKIEPEIVFKMKGPLSAGITEAAVALEAVEWLALGFEIIDCPYPDWKFQPADFVAAYGLHAALIVGEPYPVTPAKISELADQLPKFKVRLSRDGEAVEEGSGRNSLRSPALCLAELASAMTKQEGAEPLAAGHLVSSGTLTESTPIQPGATWTASVEGLDLPALTLMLV